MCATGVGMFRLMWLVVLAVDSTAVDPVARALYGQPPLQRRDLNFMQVHLGKDYPSEYSDNYGGGYDRKAIDNKASADPAKQRLWAKMFQSKDDEDYEFETTRICITVRPTPKTTPSTTPQEICFTPIIGRKHARTTASFVRRTLASSTRVATTPMYHATTDRNHGVLQKVGCLKRTSSPASTAKERSPEHHSSFHRLTTRSTVHSSAHTQSGSPHTRSWKRPSLEEQSSTHVTHEIESREQHSTMRKHPATHGHTTGRSTVTRTTAHVWSLRTPKRPVIEGCGYVPTTTTRRPTRRTTTRRTTSTRRTTTTQRTTRKPGGCPVEVTKPTTTTQPPVDEFLAAWAFYRHHNSKNDPSWRDFHEGTAKPSRKHVRAVENKKNDVVVILPPWLQEPAPVKPGMAFLVPSGKRAMQRKNSRLARRNVFWFPSWPPGETDVNQLPDKDRQKFWELNQWWQNVMEQNDGVTKK